jgi:hypothetical protein
MATRAEIRQPGSLERALGGASAFGAPGLGSMMAGGFFASMAGTVLGSMIAQQFFSTHAAPGHPFGDGAPSHDAALRADTTAGLIDDPFKHSSADRGEDFASSGDGDRGPDDGGLFDGDFGGGDGFDT